MERRKLRGGMVGGGIGSRIGVVHRMAATMDGQANIVAGVFSSNPEKSRKMGEEIYLHPTRIYGSYKEMAQKEVALPLDQRLDFVIIATPNVSHFDIARTFLEAGFNVICDKPMTYSLSEAKQLKEIVNESGRVFTLTHPYTGYPMVKQARYMVRENLLGKVNKVVVEYPQKWLINLLKDKGKSLDVWRLNPKIVGASCCTGDIGTHAENLVRYITGLEIEELCADLTAFVPGNSLDNDSNMLLHYKGGAKGILHSSQISTGEENGLNIRIYGSNLGLYWHQEDPNYLVVKSADGYLTKYSKGSNNALLCDDCRNYCRLIVGWPEGLIEALANIYLESYNAIRAQLDGHPFPACDYPTVDDGVMGMSFIETVLSSARSKQKWTKMIQ